jgi:RNA polymerase sigma-70 factor (ECF subfamily)
MKVSDPSPHSRSAGEMQPTVNKTPPVTERPQLRVVRGGDLTFRRIYERWFEDVVKWLYALGVPASDTEDLAQEVFLVVRRRLSSFEAGNIAAWIYRITELTVRDHRRRAWFKNLISRRRDMDLSEFPYSGPSPERNYEQEESRQRFQRLIAAMSGKLRATFVLFEIEGYSGEEIAQIQDIPLGTVWTRLHHARKEFWKLVRREEKRG